jgi:hypothetical protein
MMDAGEVVELVQVDYFVVMVSVLLVFQVVLENVMENRMDVVELVLALLDKHVLMVPVILQRLV